MAELPIAATGLLRSFCEARMIRLVDFHLARRICQLAGETNPTVELAIALVSRELRLGSVCLDLSTAHELLPEAEFDDGVHLEVPDLEWPTTELWLADLAASAAVGTTDGQPAALRLIGSLLYLDRYWREESRLGAALRARSAQPSAPIAAEEQPDAAATLSDPQQDAAVAAALTYPTTVITGGPGTGKTTIVARILNAMAAQRPRVALCAPTGKAASRLQSSVLGKVSAEIPLWSGTLHRLLGIRPRSTAVTYTADNPLPFDVIIVDETSMVSLELMALLLDAVAPNTRLIIVGDAHQLRSVEAGAVLADIESADDLITAPGGAIVRLQRNFRSNAAINQLATAIHNGQVEEALALVQSDAISLIDFDGLTAPETLEPLRQDVLTATNAVRSAALQGDGVAANLALLEHRILCAHREGPYGVSHWARSLRRWLGTQWPGYGLDHQHYPGQPLLIVRNSDLLSNGDTAVVVQRPGSDELVAVVDLPEEPLWIAPQLLDDAEDLHAMTIHKSQGSQFSSVSIVLPPLGSPLLTRELIYTAVTRAQDRVRIYGSAEALRSAIETPARRASGLARQ